ncbi:MAG: hypothetical protein J6D08_02005 [Lachnospiraceae bacterium]|nr:hypothetical protein [Lachnospiraceae bacterium]
MRNINFDPDNVTSLPDAGYETRDHLSDLAIAIVAAKLDLKTCDYEKIIREFDSTIRDLQDAFDQMGPMETLD